MNQCEQVRIYNSRIYNAQNYFPDSSKYSVNLTNCTDVEVVNSTINSYGVGAISSIIDTVSSDTPVNYISGNTFELQDFAGNTVKFIQSGYVTVPVRIEYCTFNTGSNYVGNIGIFLANVLEGSIKDNAIKDYNVGINLLGSSIDLFENSITSAVSHSTLINILSGSNATLGFVDPQLIGGYNGLTNSSATSTNIYIDNSTFFAEDGNNIFKIKDEDSNSYHFYGYVNIDGDNLTISAVHNCFYIGEIIDTNIILEKTGTRDPITLITYPMAGQCETFNRNQFQMQVFQSDGGIKDTLYYTQGGNGGGENNVQSSMYNVQLKNKSEKYKKVLKDGKVSYNNKESEEETTINEENEINTLKSLYAGLCLQTRMRHYDSIIIMATQLVNQFPDSTQSLYAISKLYFASFRKDSSGSKMSPLKSYLENLILIDSNNTSLIEKSFYFIQKCKVALKQYSSALAGFQQIINNNPYSYEALLASWDYAATTLLMNGGNGGGESNLQSSIDNVQFKDGNTGENAYNMEMSIQIFMDNYDTSKFTKKDRIKILDNTKKSFEKKKTKENETITSLQIRADKGDKKAEKELYIKKTIHEVAKPIKPKSFDEHIKIINNNIDKIFTNPNLKNSKKDENNNIPTKYELYQNYPNPFNPITKISFDLPKAGNVKLIVYDILGREITRLLNSEFKTAGKYIIEFNAVNLGLASGVYFYRIETDKFTAVKKMVLIK